MVHFMPKMAMVSIFPSFLRRQLGNLPPTNFSTQPLLYNTLYGRLSPPIRMEHPALNVKTSLNFNMWGDLLASSGHSDIVIWDWANREVRVVYESGHRGGVRQVKFMPYDDTKLVTCGNDGKVCERSLHSGGYEMTRHLVQHEGEAHKHRQYQSL